NVRVAAPVTLRDVASTIAGLAGFSDAAFPGASLATAWSANCERPTSRPILSYLGPVCRQSSTTSPASFGPMRSVLDEQFHYIRRGDGLEQLFDYRADPSELTDLSGTGAGRAKIQQMRLALEPAPLARSSRQN